MNRAWPTDTQQTKAQLWDRLPARRSHSWMTMRALKDANDNIAKAAITLGVSRPTLYDLLAKHHMR